MNVQPTLRQSPDAVRFKNPRVGMSYFYIVSGVAKQWEGINARSQAAAGDRISVYASLE
jgi:hypothetical protein